MQSFTERMAESKDVAARDRARGYHTGAAGKGWNRRRPVEHANDNCAWLLHWRKHWLDTCREIQTQFARQCFNGPYDNPDNWEI
jgi:ribosome modulation factor